MRKQPLTEHAGYKILKRMEIQKKIDALQKNKAQKKLSVVKPKKPKKQNVFTKYLRGTVPEQPKPVSNNTQTDMQIMKLRKKLKEI